MQFLGSKVSGTGMTRDDVVSPVFFFGGFLVGESVVCNMEYVGVQSHQHILDWKLRSSIGVPLIEKNDMKTWWRTCRASRSQSACTT